MLVKLSEGFLGRAMVADIHLAAVSRHVAMQVDQELARPVRLDMHI